MAILNFGYNKIHVEKKTKKPGQVQIKQGMNLISLNESEMIKDGKQKVFSIAFSFTTNYEPGYGSILLEGDLLYLADDKLAKEISASWKKNKALPKSVALQVFNRILHSCNVESLLLSREINLPPPMKMPKVEMQAKPKPKEKKK